MAGWILDDDFTRSQDRPIVRAESDLLNRGAFVDSLAQALVRTELDESTGSRHHKSTGYVIGLTGDWGSGKSSILNLVYEKVSVLDKVVTVRINPWLVRGRDQLIEQFFNELEIALKSSQVGSVDGIIEELRDYRDVLLGIGGVAKALAILPFMPTWLGKLPTLKKKDSAPRSVEKVRAELERRIAESGLAFVVLIDELDRVEDEDVRTVAQLVKALGDIRGISYLVAYDHKRVAEALGGGNTPEQLKSGARYLEKIVQHPVAVRPLFTEDVRNLFQEAIRQYDPGYDFSAPSDVLPEILASIRTPRDVKRLLGSFKVLWSILKDEVNPYHLLGYTFLQVKFPALRDRIASELDLFVDDPMTNEVYRRAGSGASRDMLTSPGFLGPDAEPVERMLKKIFIRFSDKDNSDDGTRLSLRRNLIRALYLGDPPGSMSHQAVRSIWSKSEEDLFAFLSGSSQSDVQAFFDRFPDLYDRLPESQSEAFWAGLARFLRRPEPWAKGPDARTGWADDLASYFFRLAQNEQMVSAWEVLGILLRHGDLSIAPRIIRTHMFRLGMVKGEPARGGYTVLTADQLDDVLHTATPLYRDAVLSGEMLQFVANPEAIFVLYNADRWDGELRQALSEQIKAPDGALTFASLLASPGHVVTKEVVAKLVKPIVLKRALDGLKAVENPWLASSRQRMLAILEGHDPMWVDRT